MASREADENEQDDFMDDTPLHQQRAFAEGLSRKPISFVPASSGNLKTTEQPGEPANKSVSDLYLNIVLSKQTASSAPASPGSSSRAAEEPQICPVCKVPVTSSQHRSHSQESGPSAQAKTSRHEASFVHQVSLEHSHPPSSIDRSRMGLSVLESQGWDPDARRGLGASGQGIQFPLKPVPKDDTRGLGLVVPKEFEGKKKEKKPALLHAGKVRKMAQEDRNKADKLRQHFYGNPDLDRYLGGS